MKQNDILTLDVTGYTSEGLGVGRADGRVVFIEKAIAGETAQVKLDKVGKNGVWAHVVQVETPSPHRREPGCPYFGRCGGCAFWHMDYAEELRLKAQRVQDALRRIGGVELPQVPIHGAPSVTEYRNKAQYPVATARQGRPVAGFYRAKSHQVIPVRRCAIQPRGCDDIVRAVTRWMEQYRIPAYDETTGRGLVRHIHLRTAMATGQVLVCLVVASPDLPHRQALVDMVLAAAPQVTSVSLSVNAKKGNAVLGDRYISLYGPMYVEDRLCGFTFRISPASFYQVNAAQAEALYDRAAQLAGLTGTENVLELYCGVGTITLALSRSAGHVTGVEIVQTAVEDARANARRNGVENVTFRQGDAGSEAARLAAGGEAPDVMVVDPPRKGLDEAVIAAIGQMAPEKLVYISCDPATLARDVARLAPHGYALQSAEAFDLFPRTHHVETVVLMSKG